MDRYRSGLRRWAYWASGGMSRRAAAISLPASCVLSDGGGGSGGGGARAVIPGGRESRRPELLPAVLGSCTCLYVAVRMIGGADGPPHVHMADSVLPRASLRGHFRRSGSVWRCRQERSVKPSAQPTLVRTQHLPHVSAGQSR